MPHLTPRCPTCKRRLTRNNDQNRRYWALLHVMAEKITPRRQTYSAETWHTWAKSKWLGCDDVKLPSGKVLSIPRSTAALTIDEFSNYMTAVEAWSAEHGAYLEDEIEALSK